MRALLVGAGVRKGYDERENASPMGGLLQAFTYESALSGGAWALGSIAGNNYPTVSSLSASLWNTAFANGLLHPDANNPLNPLTNLLLDLTSKITNGFAATLVDAYGRLLGYMLLNANDGGRATTLSGIAKLSSFTDYDVPYPIMTAIGANNAIGACGPSSNGVQYELAPYETGSWDSGVQAFTPTSLLGTAINNGQSGSCVTNYDNLGYMMGASSNVFAAICLPALTVDPTERAAVQGLLNEVHDVTAFTDYAIFPNPFANHAQSSGVTHYPSVTMLDGGSTGQNVPFWPLLHRNVDVIFAVDSSSDVDGAFPGGSSLYNTYTEDRSQGLNRMPKIPPMSTFVAQGLNSRTTFFGCNDATRPTIIYLPNKEYVYNTGTPQPQVQYSMQAVQGFLANGVKIATNGDAAGYATCVGCAIMKKSGAALPEECAACLEEYCYN